MNIKERIQQYLLYLLGEQRRKLLFDLNSVLLKNSFLNNPEFGITSNKYDSDKDVIVSLTTYGKRIYEVYLTIESIMKQTYKANRIVLWLSEDLKDADLPNTLMRQLERGLEIRYCKDIGSYKKLIPALESFPNDVIITMDDDVIYSNDTLELLIKAHKNNPSTICCNWAKEIVFDKKGLPKKYKEWGNRVISESASFRNFPIGCAGILYPPGTLDDEVMNESVFMGVCPSADDIWFKAMSLKKGTPVIVTKQGIHEFQYLDNPLWQDMGLTRINEKKCMNDVQFKAVVEKYGLCERLR